MSLKTTLANSLWLGSNLAAARRFHASLAKPDTAQSNWLSACLKRNATSDFGQSHGFSKIRSYADFVASVPVSDWDDYEPWIDRICSGEQNTLISAPVTHLAPTSGSSGARKLIPFSRPLHQSFGVAVGAWMTDLTLLRPSLLGGSSYWSISPQETESQQNSAVRIGFADDADYLGRAGAWLARQAMAAPNSLRHIQDPDDFWYQTAFHLLKRGDLALISIWHPSFLQLLIEAVQANWRSLLAAIRSSGKKRAQVLSRADPQKPDTWWPRLAVISCWGELAALPGLQRIQRQFPNAMVQPKGLLATEAVVTLAWQGSYPLAINSHFFEFIDETGKILRAQEISPGNRYEVLVTNGGGLWRYRLHDLVECTGWKRSTPCLRFLGRVGRVSDLRGEKLSEPFVAETLGSLYPKSDTICWLQADADRPGYTLYTEDASPTNLLQSLEDALCQNPHYRHARQLGQLRPAIVVSIKRGADSERLATSRQGLGNTKPRVLVLSSEIETSCRNRS